MARFFLRFDLPRPVPVSAASYHKPWPIELVPTRAVVV
jgi:hypothetical protein